MVKKVQYENNKGYFLFCDSGDLELNGSLMNLDECEVYKEIQESTLLVLTNVFNLFFLELDYNLNY